MGFRFRKTLSIIPGIRVILSKSGISTSVGKPGATLNFSSRGTRATVGLPGSGLSYSEKLDSAPKAGRGWIGLAVVAVLLVVWFFGR